MRTVRISTAELLCFTRSSTGLSWSSSTARMMRCMAAPIRDEQGVTWRALRQSQLTFVERDVEPARHRLVEPDVGLRHLEGALTPGEQLLTQPGHNNIHYKLQLTIIFWVYYDDPHETFRWGYNVESSIYLGHYLLFFLATIGWTITSKTIFSSSRKNICWKLYNMPSIVHVIGTILICWNNIIQRILLYYL